MKVGLKVTRRHRSFGNLNCVCRLAKGYLVHEANYLLYAMYNLPLNLMRQLGYQTSKGAASQNPHVPARSCETPRIR